VIRSTEPLPIYPIGRTVNVVPVSDLRKAARYVDTATQTVGVFPDARRADLRDVLCASGAQRIVPLGASIGTEPPHGRPHDGYNVLHRMVRWVVEEERPPAVVRV
jgi:Acyl-CoA reductase (LuxC)